MAKADTEIIDFVRQTTVALTIISESTKGIQKVSEDLRNSMDAHNAMSIANFQKTEGKLDGLLMMFKYVIIPLITGILALTGIKTIFKI